MVVEGGRSVGQTTPENARRDGLTVVDLSDDWLPCIFSEEGSRSPCGRPIWSTWPTGRSAGARATGGGEDRSGLPASDHPSSRASAQSRQMREAHCQPGSRPVSVSQAGGGRPPERSLS
jgi:hypothetical protein